jgi:acetyl esterase
MTQHYPLTPELWTFIQDSVRFTSPDAGVAAQRETYDQMCRTYTPQRPAELQIVDTDIAGVPTRFYRPRSQPPASGWPAILYLHGGGWMVGNLDSHEFLTTELSQRLHALVIAVDYRLAPEHPFPAPLDDCLAVWRDLTCHADLHQLDPERFAVAGDSAGGNLAAALCLALQYSGEPLPCGQALIYPALTADRLPSEERYADAPLLSAQELRTYLTAYLPNAADGDNPLAMPLAATDLANLPPAFISVNEFDPLRDHGIRYAEYLRKADVEVNLYEGTGLVHGSLRAQTAQARALREALIKALQELLDGEMSKKNPAMP